MYPTRFLPPNHQKQPQSYIVSPMENSDSTEEFINRTDSTLSLSKSTLTSAALYSLELTGESITSKEADAKSTPISSPIAYPHNATISSILFYFILLFSIGQENYMLYFFVYISWASSLPKYIFLGGVASFQDMTWGMPVTVLMMIEGQSTPDLPIFIVSVPLSIMIISRRFIQLSMNFLRLTGLLGPPKTGVLSMISFKYFNLLNSNYHSFIFPTCSLRYTIFVNLPWFRVFTVSLNNNHLKRKLQKMYEDDEGSEENQSFNQQGNESQHSHSEHSRHSGQQKSMSSERSSRKQSEQSSEFQDREMQVRKWQWAYPIIQGVSPCQRGGHSATLSGASIVIFGGHYYTGKNEGYAYLNDTYVLDVNANKFTKPKISGTPPAPRYAHSAVLAGSKIIIFGGRGDKSKVFRDLHALDPVSMTWLQGPEGIGSPSARYGHTAVLVAETKIFIFGGTNGKEYYNDLYVLDLQVMAWSQPKCQGPLPSPRQGHTAIQVGTNMIIQGGFNFDQQAQRNAGFRQGTQLQSCYLNDIRILDTQKYEWARVRVSGTPPLPRYGHTANISGPDIIFFGGWSINSGARGQQNFIPPADIDYFIVLNTDNELVWEKGKFQGQPPLSRYGHTATSIGPHILIFGGWEFNRAASEVVVLRDMTAASKKK